MSSKWRLTAPKGLKTLSLDIRALIGDWLFGAAQNMGERSDRAQTQFLISLNNRRRIATKDKASISCQLLPEAIR